MNRHGPQIRHDPPGYAASPAGYLITVYKGNVRTSAKGKTGLSGQTPQFEEDKPHKKLGFTPVWMPKRHNTAAFSAQCPLIGPEDMIPSPQYYSRYTQDKKKVKPAEKPAYEEDNF
jgi:hypothetical protein